jgi:hypothetical protein
MKRHGRAEPSPAAARRNKVAQVANLLFRRLAVGLPLTTPDAWQSTPQAPSFVQTRHGQAFGVGAFRLVHRPD